MRQVVNIYKHQITVVFFCPSHGITAKLKQIQVQIALKILTADASSAVLPSDMERAFFYITVSDVT